MQENTKNNIKTAVAGTLFAGLMALGYSGEADAKNAPAKPAVTAETKAMATSSPMAGMGPIPGIPLSSAHTAFKIIGFLGMAFAVAGLGKKDDGQSIDLSQELGKAREPREPYYLA